MKKAVHPTRERLIQTMADLLDEERPERITADMVLAKSGVSKGSLYHHFADFEELLEAALVQRFSSSVDESVENISDVLHKATSREEFFQALGAVTADTQSPERSDRRYERARAVGLAGSNERFRVVLGLEQQRLTDAFTDIFREAQHRGWIQPDIDPHALAVFIQAYTLGRIVDDIAPNKVDPTAWVNLINRIANSNF